MPRFTWTDEAIATLRALWPDHSASQIGEKLGKTRMAVIGKANRLDLPAKGGSFRTERKERKRATPPPRVVRAVPRLPAPPPSPLSRSLMDLEPHQCRWPTDPDWCGHPKDHESYCDYHQRRAYVRRAYVSR